MIDLAGQVVNGQLDLEGLRDVSPDEAYKRLLAIKGIGHWTAAVTLERAFGHTDWVAYNDVVLQAATNRYLLGGSGRFSRNWWQRHLHDMVAMRVWPRGTRCFAGYSSSIRSRTGTYGSSS